MWNGSMWGYNTNAIARLGTFELIMVKPWRFGRVTFNPWRFGVILWLNRSILVIPWFFRETVLYDLIRDSLAPRKITINIL